MVESLRALRPELADLNARLDVAEALAETLPHRRKYLLLNHRPARRIVRAYEEWLDLGDSVVEVLDDRIEVGLGLGEAIGLAVDESKHRSPH